MERRKLFITLLAGTAQAAPKIARVVCQFFSVVSCCRLITLTALWLIVSASLVGAFADPAGVANLLSQKVDGILTTGYPCGFKRTPVTQIRSDVRVLVLMGSERLDHYLLEAHLASGYATLQDLCAKVFAGHPYARWKQFYSLGHAPLAGHLELFAAINEFFGIKTAR